MHCENLPSCPESLSVDHPPKSVVKYWRYRNGPFQSRRREWHCKVFGESLRLTDLLLHSPHTLEEPRSVEPPHVFPYTRTYRSAPCFAHHQRGTLLMHVRVRSFPPQLVQEKWNCRGVAVDHWCQNVLSEPHLKRSQSLDAVRLHAVVDAQVGAVIFHVHFPTFYWQEFQSIEPQSQQCHHCWLLHVRAGSDAAPQSSELVSADSLDLSKPRIPTWQLLPNCSFALPVQLRVGFPRVAFSNHSRIAMILFPYSIAGSACPFCSANLPTHE